VGHSHAQVAPSLPLASRRLLPLRNPEQAENPPFSRGNIQMEIKTFSRRRRKFNEMTKKVKGTISSPLAPAILALVGGLLGTLVGQKMNATTEADKVIRTKLEEAYFETLSLPSLAEDLHMSVFRPIKDGNFELVVSQYQLSNNKFRDTVSRVVAVSDLYEPNLSVVTKRVVDCNHRFTAVIANLFLIEAESSGKTIVHPPSYSNPRLSLAMPEARDTAVNVRLECQRIDDDLRATISAAMKSHL
jgi:hypothetical protein